MYCRQWRRGGVILLKLVGWLVVGLMGKVSIKSFLNTNNLYFCFLNLRNIYYPYEKDEKDSNKWVTG